MDNMIYWIWLSLACTPDTSTFPKLISKFKNAFEIYSADQKEISACVGYSSSDRTALLDKDLARAEGIYNFCKKHKVGLASYDSSEYPDSLRKIPTPPVLLYYRGVMPDFNKSFLTSIVGTRSLSSYGRKAAFRIGYDLACAGTTVVSGMAMGIDSVALAGAIAAGKPTVAVIGSGIDVCYPKQHLTLAREIVKCGCVITEYAPGTPPNRFNFPRRNRIVSGLSAATLVVEGRERSGALITARHAKNQGKTVYAFPGNVESPNSEVSNLLIKGGAKMCTSADDIVRDFQDKYVGIVNPFGLSSSVNVDMMSELSRLSVVAVCPDDPIFKPSRVKMNRNIQKEHSSQSENVTTEAYDNAPASEQPFDFDAKSLSIYKKIPISGECAIESLVDAEITLKDVMRCLLKLEMGKFILMLPGEKVCRKPK